MRAASIFDISSPSHAWYFIGGIGRLLLRQRGHAECTDSVKRLKDGEGLQVVSRATSVSLCSRHKLHVLQRCQLRRVVVACIAPSAFVCRIAALSQVNNPKLRRIIEQMYRKRR